MEKIVKTLVVILYICISVFAGNSSITTVVSHEKMINKSSSDEVLKIFHSLQNIYIKSIINNDTLLKEKALEVLIKSAKILGIDYKNYQNELETIKSLENSPKTIKHPKNIIKIKSVKHKTGIPKITSLYIDNSKMILQFSRDVKKSDVKTFVLKTKNSYKKVFDISAFLSRKFRFKYPKDFKSIKIAQHNPKIVRVVLETKNSRKYKIDFGGNRITIYFRKEKNIKHNHENKKTYSRKKEYFYNTFNQKEKIIVLDPGHGGKDSGAIGYKKRYEKKAVLQIALKCAKELKKRGYIVYLTRSRDVFVKLRDRTKYANRKNADLFVSIHANAAPKKSKYLLSKGIETFFLSRARSERSKRVAALENRSDIEDMNYFSKKTFLDVLNREKIIQANKMALDVQQGMLKSLRKRYRVVDGGVREAPFWVLVGAQMPAILIEVGYITNPAESERLFNFQYQSLLAKGIADGINNYFLKNQ